jgi:hypothetical protein
VVQDINRQVTRQSDRFRSRPSQMAPVFRAWRRPLRFGSGESRDNRTEFDSPPANLPSSALSCHRGRRKLYGPIDRFRYLDRPGSHLPRRIGTPRTHRLAPCREPDIHENTRSTNGSHHFSANATAVKWNEPIRSAPPQPNAGCKRRCRAVSLNTKTKMQKSNANN